MEVKKLDKSDLNWLFPLESSCFGTQAWTEAMILSHFVESEGIGVKDLGYVLYKLVGDEIEIYKVAVDSSQRREGKAKQMLEFLLDSQKDKTFFLEVSSNNLPAIGLYNSCGFQRIHIRKHYYSDGSDALIFKKTPVDDLENFSFDIP
ncbi:GNAT family N-acetyltransferase [Leptospira sp. 201903070]|uniref:GNAT family N-acetyltransferase n=1 Tax=Leptospira ainlahdjerensis TaxID=2810033 RepID=A0ABS2UFU2_9LEPT|nr:GNAT family N-acetyltransferase [Leptospira ainlahdjerensis]MBM9579251.1 GNAT family N-acetyltransferase [Leptospira ainlahdjerensis]